MNKLTIGTLFALFTSSVCYSQIPETTHMVSRPGIISERGGGLKEVPFELKLDKPLPNAFFEFTVSPEGLLLWFETAGPTHYIMPQCCYDTPPDINYDPESSSMILHACDQNGKDVYTVTIPQKVGSEFNRGYFPTSHTVSLFLMPRYGNPYLNHIVNLETGEIFTNATTSETEMMGFGQVSPDGRRVVFKSRDLKTDMDYVIVNGKIVMPFFDEQALDPTVSSDEYKTRISSFRSKGKPFAAKFFTGRFRSNSFSPDGRYLAVLTDVGPNRMLIPDKGVREGFTNLQVRILDLDQAGQGMNFEDYSESIPVVLSESDDDLFETWAFQGRALDHLHARFEGEDIILGLNGSPKLGKNLGRVPESVLPSLKRLKRNN